MSICRNPVSASVAMAASMLLMAVSTYMTGKSEGVAATFLVLAAWFLSRALRRTRDDDPNPPC